MALGIPLESVVRDYWLTTCLHGVANSETGGIAQRGDTGEMLARYAFAGGTSLVSAWGITERYSEDLDLLALGSEHLSGSAVQRVLSLPSKWATAAIGASDDDVVNKHMGDMGFRRTLFALGGQAEFLKMETTVETNDERIWDVSTASSLMGRFASDEQRSTYPELGGFEMPCIVPGYTAANKFDALHRRAVTRDFRGLTVRGRDLYDLAQIAQSDHAEAASGMVPEMAERASLSPGRRDDVPRPRGGYANSPAFDPRTEAGRALEAGYEQTVEELVWGQAPPFGEAAELAQRLDDTS
ncbi:nucleotidyl transferase AbiEii/AbiGii toxin family protein [Candidatus Poriferisocius sp.]|uniref:nucleotidyl transferase AbiEii/AbiGii toxin family protein n=1 Tax=Candidatus Poriferisocius sp. TaxID=3101276 RepID=UPI003B028720